MPAHSPRKSLRPHTKKGTSIRHGFRYQDLVAARSLLSMIRDPEGPLSVAIEHRPGGSFDDVVERFPSVLVCRQVKHAEHPTSEPLTLARLGKPWGRARQPLVLLLAKSWKNLVGRGTPARLQLFTNRMPDGQLRRLLRGNPARLREDLSPADAGAVVRALRKPSGLRLEEFWNFIRSLEFAVQQKDREELAVEIKSDLKRLGAGDVFERLITAIGQWAVDSKKEWVTCSEVEQVLGIAAAIPDNTFHIERETLVGRQSVHAVLADLLARDSGDYLAVLGSPGSGKSTMLNTFGDSSPRKERNDHVFIYNCFVGATDDQLKRRASAANFVTWLLRELSEIRGWTRRKAEPADLETVLKEASLLLSEEKRLVVIIDGLDYARRWRVDGELALFDILPPKLPPGVKLVVSAQAQAQLPAHLQGLPSEFLVPVPMMAIGQIREMLSKGGVFEAWKVKKRTEQNRAAELLLDRSGGHPLFIRYAVAALLKVPSNATSLAESIDRIPEYGGDIRDWYKRLPGYSDPYTRALVAVMARSPFPLGAGEANDLLGSSRDRFQAEEKLEELGFLFSRMGDQYVFRHDSLRAHVLLSDETAQAPSLARYFEFLTHLRDDPRIGEHAAKLSVECGHRQWSESHISMDWLAHCLASGSRWADVRTGLGDLFRDAIDRRDWPAATRWSLCHEIMTREVRYAIDPWLTDAWIASDRIDLVEREITEGDAIVASSEWLTALVTKYSEARRHADAERFARHAAMIPPEVDGTVTWHEVEKVYQPYVQLHAQRTSTTECWKLIKGLAQQISDAQPGMVVLKASEVTQYLASTVAFHFLFTGNNKRLREWLRIAGRTLPSEDKGVLRASLALRSKGHGTPSRSVTAAMLRDAPLWLLSDAAKKKDRRALVKRALDQKSASMCDALVEGHRPEDFESAVHMIWTTARLALVVGASDCLHRLEQRIMPPPWFGESLLVALTLRTAEAVGDLDDPQAWKRGGDASIATMQRAVRDRLQLNQLESQLQLAAMMRALLARLRRVASRSEALPEYSRWCRTVFVPAARDARLLPWSVELEVVSHEAIPFADPVERDDWVSELARGCDDDVSHKSQDFFRLAIAVSRGGNTASGIRLIGNACRAAFSYGYRKDITVLLFIECLAELGMPLGAELCEMVALVSSTLEVLRTLTDHAELTDAGTELVAATSLHQPELAAHLGAVLFDRLEGHLCLGSVAEWLLNKGIDPWSRIDHFIRTKTPVPFWGWPGQDQPIGREPDEARLGLDDLLTRYSTLPKDLDDPRNLLHERLARWILLSVRSEAELVRAQTVLESRGAPHYLRREVARKYIALGLPTAARPLLTPEADYVFGNEFEYPSYSRLRALFLFAELDPAEAWSRFEAAARSTAAVRPGVWDPFHATVAIVLAAKAGHTQSAIAGLRRFAEHLRELMRQYPNTEMEWDAILARRADSCLNVRHLPAYQWDWPVILG